MRIKIAELLPPGFKKYVVVITCTRQSLKKFYSMFDLLSILFTVFFISDITTFIFRILICVYLKISPMSLFHMFSLFSSFLNIWNMDTTFNFLSAYSICVISGLLSIDWYFSQSWVIFPCFFVYLIIFDWVTNRISFSPLLMRTFINKCLVRITRFSTLAVANRHHSHLYISSGHCSLLSFWWLFPWSWMLASNACIDDYGKPGWKF